MSETDVSDDVELFVNKLREHNHVKECSFVKQSGSRYVYAVSFSDKCDRQGIEDIFSSMRSVLQEVGYRPREILSVFDDSTVDKVPEFEEIGRNERVVQFKF